MTLRNIAYVNGAIWEQVRRALQAQQQPPIFYDLMFDAIEHIEHGDLQRATVDLAVACEAYMRKLILAQLPQNMSGSIKRYIDEANIRQYINHFIPDMMREDELKRFKRISSNLNKLFSARNDILHSGRKDDLTSEECQKYVETTRELIAIK